MLTSIVGFLAGFVCGYGIRDFISKRRRAAARARFYMENRAIRRNDGQTKPFDN
jgi:hypothetical protein